MSLFRNKNHLYTGAGIIFLLGILFLITQKNDELQHYMNLHNHDHGDHDHSNSNRLHERLQELDLLIKKEPQIIKWKIERAHINLELNPKESVQEYRKLYLEQPDDLYLLLHLSQALIQVNDITQAYLYAKELLSKARNSESLELMAQIYYRKKQYQNAINYAEECLEFESHNLNAKNIIEYSKIMIDREKIAP